MIKQQQKMVDDQSSLGRCLFLSQQLFLFLLVAVSWNQEADAFSALSSRRHPHRHEIKSLNGQWQIQSPDTTSFTNPSHAELQQCSLQRQQRRLQRNPQRSDSTTSTALSAISLSQIQSVLHRDPCFCLTAVLFLSYFGISLERRTMIGKALSAPLATMALALTVANVGLIPFASPIYAAANAYLVPLAVPLLLFDSDLRRVLRDTGSLLTAFGVGALATVVGTLVAYPLLPLRSLGIDGYKIACCLAARHIGGAINFVAVAETLKVSATAVSAAIAADNVVVALYFAFLFALAKPGDETGESSTTVGEETKDIVDTVVVVDPESVDNNDSSSSLSLPSVALSLCVSSALVTAGGILSKAFLPAGTSALPLTSILTVVMATVFPSFFTKLRSAGNALGVLFIQMFFAASGAAGSIRLVMQQAPSLFAFSVLQIAVHFVVLMGVGRRIFGLQPRELYLASNANVGGPTTAAAMAQAKEWKRLVLPALLIGILGYSTATAIALALAPVLLKLPTL